MFGDRALKYYSYEFGRDPAADDDLPVLVAAEALTIKHAYLTVPNDIAAGTANMFDVALYNGGTVGTALTAVAGTVGGSVGWTGLRPVAFTITDGYMTAGQLLKLRYDETGTATIQGAVLTIAYVNGVGEAV